jgi:hypothetical protein
MSNLPRQRQNLLRKRVGGGHRPARVRARWTDANLENIEDADG